MSNKKLTLFAVDGSQLLSEKIADQLSAMGAIDIVGHAFTCEDAYLKIKNFNPDAVLLDIDLPDLGGLKLITRIKKDFNKIEVIVFTNLADSYYRKKSNELGADYFFDKSTEFDQLLAALTGIIDRGTND